MALSDRHCVPCEGGIAALDGPAADALLGQVVGWQRRGERIHKRFELDDFRQAMAFVNRIAVIAEEEGHHPDFSVHYSSVDVTLWTFAARGLTENDFILASKIDGALQPR